MTSVLTASPGILNQTARANQLARVSHYPYHWLATEVLIGQSRTLMGIQTRP
jgi:hypothetical protein